METNNTACNELRTFPRCSLTIARGQTYGAKARARCLTETPAVAVVVTPKRVALPADYDGNYYVVAVDGEAQGELFLSRRLAGEAAAKYRAEGYDTVSVRRDVIEG